MVCYGDFVSVNKQTFFRDRLEVRVFADRAEAGAAGAEIAAGIMRDEIARAGRAAVVFASAVSQDAFLAALRAQEVDWTRVTAFHMDEYAGMRGGPSGVVPALFAGAFVRPRAGGGVSRAGWRGGGRRGRVRALCGTARGGGAVPGDHGNRRERAPGVHRPAGVRFQRSAGCAAGGTRRCVPHAAGTRWSVRAAGGGAARARFR